MKKSLSIIFIYIIFASIMLASCDRVSDVPIESPTPIPVSSSTPDVTEPIDSSTPDVTEPVSSSTPSPTEDNGFDISGDDWEFGIYRPAYYSLNTFIAGLVDRDVYYEWMISRSPEEYNNECVAVAFVKHFNIPREDFERANEETRIFREEYDFIDSPSFELYPVDLIYTFDNELINEYFLWENGPYEDPR